MGGGRENGKHLRVARREVTAASASAVRQGKWEEVARERERKRGGGGG